MRLQPDAASVTTMRTAEGLLNPASLAAHRSPPVQASNSIPRVRRRIIFVTSSEGWGGSEELWANAATRLAMEGHAVTVCVWSHPMSNIRLRRLLSASGSVVRLAWPLTFNGSSRNIVRIFRLPRAALGLGRFWLLLRGVRRPDLVVISQASNFDGVYLASICRRLGLPYVLVTQKASEWQWNPDSMLHHQRAAYSGALHSYFVSRHNLRLTEEQLGLALPLASVVRNPFLVSWDQRSDWPSGGDSWRLACVARLFPLEKGQDMLLRVLAREKWRARNLTVSFFGVGPFRESLECMAAFLGVVRVRFHGFIEDTASIWNDHHGLILPSRCEGLPLVVVETMLSGRLPIVTDVAGNREVIEDGETGFLAGGANENALDDVMERAWQRRAEWQFISQRAAVSIRSRVPRDPVGVFSDKLLRLIAA
jgi:glycosyltransferase involved in cell wall biosynthesis